MTPLTVAVAITALSLSSAGLSRDRAVDPASATWTERGNASLAAGQTEAATDAYETAAALDPANTAAFNGLAAAAMAQDLPGKAIRFYREALLVDGSDRVALAGIGVAFATKGATSQAEASLARLDAVCGTDCPGRTELMAALERGTVTAAAVEADPVVQQAN